MQVKIIMNEQNLIKKNYFCKIKLLIFKINKIIIKKEKILLNNP